MKFLGFIFIFIFSVHHTAWSQDVLEQGKIVMELTDVSSENPQIAMAMGGMKGMKTEFNFKDDMHVTDMDMGFVKVKVLVDKKNNKMDMLNDAMGNKSWIEASLDADQKAQQVAENTTVKTDKSKTKEVAGYPCYYFEFSNPDMPDLKVSGYITEKIKSNANMVQGFQAVKLDGFMLEYSVATPQMTMTTSAVEVSQNVDNDKFILNTKGYTKMTMDEFTEMMQKFGGGGF
jgi:hypothetical protein